MNRIGNGFTCSECGNFETGKSFTMIMGASEPDALWCVSCIRNLGLSPVSKPCGHLVTAPCYCEVQS